MFQSVKRAFVTVIGVLILTACGSVDPGERAVFAIWGKVQDKCFTEDWYWYNPFSTDMYELDIKPHGYEVKGISAASHDLQEVHLDLQATISIDGTNCHKLIQDVGRNFADIIINPALQEIPKAVTARYTVEKLIQDRASVRNEIKDALKSRLTPYHLIVGEVNIKNFAPSKNFMTAVEEKQIEAQKVQTAENKRLQAVKNAETAVAEAKGKADSAALIQKALTQNPEFLRYKELEVIEKTWDGHLPVYWAPGSAGKSLIQLPQLQQSQGKAKE